MDKLAAAARLTEAQRSTPSDKLPGIARLTKDPRSTKYRCVKRQASSCVMKTIRHTSTLFYYDGIQVFEALDAIGGHYIAVLAESVDDVDHYILAGVEPEKLRQFRTGVIDLRSLLFQRIEDDWFIAIPRKGFDAPLECERQNQPMGNNPNLPDSGFLLHDTQADTDTVQEARTRNNLENTLTINDVHVELLTRGYVMYKMNSSSVVPIDEAAKKDSDVRALVESIKGGRVAAGAPCDAMYNEWPPEKITELHNVLKQAFP